MGVYSSPPSPYYKVRAAVVDFNDKTGYGLGDAAGEQLETLVMRSDRFSLIDRQRLDDLLREQGLHNIVNPEELARPGRVRGVDYLFLGSITNFRVQVVREKFLGGVFDRVIKPVAPLDINTSKTVVKTDVGVDLKLVNTTTGEIVAKEFAEMSREDIASAWGLRVLGIGGNAENELRVDSDSQGKILRWALHETYKKMVPRIDRVFSKPPPELPPREPQSPREPRPVAPGAVTRPSSPSDYMGSDLYLAKAHPNSGRWVPSIMKTDPVGEKKQAEFTDVRSNKTFWSSKFSRTRPAPLEDIKVGATVSVMYDTFADRDAAAKRWKNRLYHWEESTVADVKSLDRQFFQAPCGGALRDIHLSNARVGVE
ncbi:MAG: hypothetical protein O7J95_15275 [Planctomycetota bacterium]|nr:hypothetical protein [Planctomycetota bacterium]